MMRLASPAFAAGGALALPLVEGPPMEFRQLPVSVWSWVWPACLTAASHDKAGPAWL